MWIRRADSEVRRRHCVEHRRIFADGRGEKQGQHVVPQLLRLAQMPERFAFIQVGTTLDAFVDPNRHDRLLLIFR